MSEDRSPVVGEKRPSLASSEDMDFGYVLVDDAAPTAEVARTALIEGARVEWDIRFQDEHEIVAEEAQRRWFKWTPDGEGLVPCAADDPNRDSEWWSFDLSGVSS